jgi:hypothetical protein
LGKSLRNADEPMTTNGALPAGGFQENPSTPDFQKAVKASAVALPCVTQSLKATGELAPHKNIAQLEPKEKIPRLTIRVLFVMRRAQMDILRTTARASVV